LIRRTVVNENVPAHDVGGRDNGLSGRSSDAFSGRKTVSFIIKSNNHQIIYS
jgi:hypothetical protein